MTIVRSLAGWIAFALVGAFAADRWAALAGLVVALISLGLAWREHHRLDTAIIELATVVFFAVVTVVTFAATRATFGLWISVASQLWLGLTVAGTLLLRHPFTLAIARTQAPPEVVASRQFYDFNVRITVAWMTSFFAAAIILAILQITGVHQQWVAAVVIVAAILIPIRYTDARRRQFASDAWAAGAVG